MLLQMTGEKRLKKTGPKITIAKPRSNIPIHSPVDIKIKFTPGSAPIDLSTLKVTLVGWMNIDLTHKVQKYATPEGIHAEKLNLPMGSHTVRLTLGDQNGKTTVKEATFTVV